MQRNLTIINYAEECCMAPFMTFESTGFRFYILDMTVALSTIDLQMCRSLCVCVCAYVSIFYINSILSEYKAVQLNRCEPYHLVHAKEIQWKQLFL